MTKQTPPSQADPIRLRPLLSHVVPLDEYPTPLATAAAKKDGYMKGVVKLADALAA